jgi:hypothetical protein
MKVLKAFYYITTMIALLYAFYVISKMSDLGV